MRATAGRPRGGHALPWIPAHRVLPEGSAAARLPARALGELLSARAAELRRDCGGPDGFGLGLGDDDPRPRGGSIAGRPPRKRARGSPGNDAHSILRFVERILQERYGDGRAKSKNGDEEFLEDELRCYFGSEDVLFQAEEAVLCSAFEMALAVMVQSGDAEACADLVDNDKSNDPKSDRSASAGCPPGKQEQTSEGPSGVATGGICGGAIKTALRIVDRVIFIDRRERATRDRLRRTKMNDRLSSRSNVTGRRKKYEHLLRPNEKGHGNGAIRGTQSGALPEPKSILEEKYPEQLEWLRQFRRGYELKHEGTENELRLSRRLVDEKTDESSAMDEGPSNSAIPSADEKDKRPGSNFVIVRRKVKTWDDMSLSSDEGDEKIDKELGTSDANTQGQNLTDGKPPMNNVASSQSEPKMLPESPSAQTLSPRSKLDQEARELRAALLDMPPGESSSTEVVRHTVDEIGDLLGRYGELNGAAGISRCGDVLGGLDLASDNSTAGQGTATNRFPLNDSMVSLLAKAFLTDATGSLRAGAFLRSFVLPLVVEMNPVARALATRSNVEDQKGAKGKPAPRALTSLLMALARDRPMECVASVVVPSLSLKKYMPSAPSAVEDSFEPTRFQCELILRALRGKDALSIPAITHLVEEVLPTNGETTSDNAPIRGGMKWTENTMPILTSCLNRQPTLPDAAVAKLADEVSHQLSPTSPQSMLKSMKFSTLFHALVTKYGSQLKSMGRVESLKNSATRLKTFMSKTISLSLKKLS